jgi:Peptidase family M48
VPATVTADSVLKQTSLLIEEIRSASFPELGKAEIQLQLLKSDVDFFRTRFGFPQFVLGTKMHYLIKVNPKLFELCAPEEGLKAIIAHELSHVVYYSKGNRIRLFGLTRLLSKSFTAHFERWTDLQAISRGYGEGLKSYRQWLYQNVPPNKLQEKYRDYFSPAEIDAILLRIQRRPQLLGYWLKHIPGNLNEIEKQ